MATIIIVDDSEAIRTHLRQVLEAAGHKVIEAEDGTQGLAKILELKTPDLVISDYNMPGLDGVAMLTKVKEALGSGKFPIFMLTTETGEQLKAAGKAVGVNAWISKPFVPEKIVAGVEKILSMKKA